MNTHLRAGLAAVIFRLWRTRVSACRAGLEPVARAGAQRHGRRREHAEVAGRVEARLARRRRRGLLVAGRRRRTRVRPQPPRSRRARHGHRSRHRQGRCGSRSTPRRSTRTSTRRTMAKGPHATPLVIGDRVFTLGGMAVLSAWNAQTGALAWRKDYSASVDTSKLFTGTAASPLADGGSVIVQVGSDVQGRARHRARPADGRRALDVERQGARLRLPRRRHRRRRQADRHDDQRLDRRASTRRPARRSGRCPSPTTGTRTSSRRSGPGRI